MAKLSDLVNVNINIDYLTIQGQQVPIMFSMESMEYVQEAYGKSYAQFEADMNKMMRKGQVRMGKKELKLIRSLIYAMVRSGGTECTLSELEGSIPFYDIVNVYDTAMSVFLRQNFQEADVKLIKDEKK
ncbi:hypothetical protein [Carnobacterium maltaromaticum]|uniref:hypothetical protein n=1 Tax=Carnobacterium maltaromaticum TaxID=2751 RepID=UPI00191BA4A2|nr:hypothetical protein [Carnobacterium maltaromaticum]CAD5902451.1 conserved hypothetical protein [Carnobacterium maltaromaticum]